MRTSSSRRVFLGATAAAGLSACCAPLRAAAAGMVVSAAEKVSLASALSFLQTGRAGKIGMVRAYAQYSHAGNGTARGIVSELGVYWMDFILSAARETGPRRVFSTGSRTLVDGAPETQVVCYEFAAFTAVWEHRCVDGLTAGAERTGCYFYGANGTLHVDAQGEWDFEGGDRETGSNSCDAGTVSGAVSSPAATRERGRRAAMLCRLAMVSYERGCAIQWDAARDVCVGDEAANGLLAAV